MKIGVDIRVLMDEYYSGIASYTANLLAALLRHDRENNYKLFYNSYRDLSGRLNSWLGERVTVVATRWPNKIFNYFLQEVLAYPKLDKVLGGVDLFWSPHFNFIRLSREAGLKKIITVHDLSFLRYPEFFNWRKNFWHRALRVPQQLRAADFIVAVSENTKNDLIELVGVAAEKVAVIYPGNNLVKREITDVEINDFLLRYSLLSRGQSRYILYLGNIEPRKNISGLLAAFNQLRAKDEIGARQLTDVKLILAGGNGWKTKKIYQDWRQSPYQKDIKFLGYISQKDKEILYYLAALFVYPSFYEGFGFPPLEALTYGLPVVCSNVSSLPEVVGQAALMINPFKSEEMAEAMRLILTDEKIRATLAAAIPKRLKLFSWDRVAEEYLSLFKKVCGQ